MRRFVYGPDVGAYIATQEYGVLDVSEDIVSGSVTRRLDAASSASLTLQNRFKKYNRKIKPMDKIVIYLQRVHQPVLSFSGYIDEAPFDQLFPGTVDLKATCTLKRLLNTYWDPGLPYVQKFLAQYAGWQYVPLTGQFYDPQLNLNNMDFNGGLGELLRIIMNKVGNWPIGLQGESKNTVHVLKLPNKFLKKTEAVFAKQVKAEEADREQIKQILKQLLTVDGSFGAPFGTQTSDYNPESSFTDFNPISKNYAKTYKASIFGKPISDDVLPPTPETLYNFWQTAGATYSIPWSVLASINHIESNFGQNMGPSSAGAIGWMQFLPSTWDAHGVDADGDGHKNAWAPADAIYGAAEYLHAAGGSDDIDRGIFAYNHAQWYVDEVKALAATFESKSQEEMLTYIKDNGVGAPRNPDGSKIVDVGTKTASPDGTPGDTYVPLSVWKGTGQTPTSFRIKGNPYGNESMIFQSVGYKLPDGKAVPDGHVYIYIPSGTPQATAWQDKDVTIETSKGGKPFERGTATLPQNTTKKIKMDEASLSGPGGVSTAGMTLIGRATLGFIQANFGPFRLTSGVRKDTFVSNSDHDKGLAVDLQPVTRQPDGSYQPWTEEGIGRCDNLAKWAGFVQQSSEVSSTGAGGQPETSGNPVTRWVGWRFVEGHGPPTGEGAYIPASGQGTGPHIHVSFRNVSPDLIPDASGTLGPGTSPGTVVLGDTGVKQTETSFAQSAFSIAFGGLALTLPTVTDAIESQFLTGYRALQNDVPLMEWVQFLTQSSGRRFMSMPNGDFVAFYADYFNWADEAPYFLISPLETIDLNIQISDEQLATHVFGIGDTMTDGQINFADRMASAVASVETAGSFRDFAHVDDDFDPRLFLARYGARPKTVQNLDIKNSLLLSMFTWMEFLKQWSLQISAASASFTFLPELIPGGLVQFTAKDLVMFVEEVTHTFDRNSGFTTQATLTSPSTASGAINYGMTLMSDGYKQPTYNPIDSSPGHGGV